MSTPKVGGKTQGVPSTLKSRETCPPVHPWIYAHAVRHKNLPSWCCNNSIYYNVVGKIRERHLWYVSTVGQFSITERDFNTRCHCDYCKQNIPFISVCKDNTSMCYWTGNLSQHQLTDLTGIKGIVANFYVKYKNSPLTSTPLTLCHDIYQ